jgi:hemerythrin-like domain-containing protein
MAGKTARAAGVFGMLKEDHTKAKALFKDFESANGDQKRVQIAAKAIFELEVHADLEEKLIYPAIRKEIDEDDLMNEAVEEHHLVHVLLKELKKLKPKDEKFRAKFKVLGELVKHHIEEEEGEMLPKAGKSDIDWEALEVAVIKRKEQLVGKTTRGRSSPFSVTQV